MHFIVGPWLLPPVWNDWAPLLVPWSQRVAEFSKIFGAGGGSGVFGCCGCSQLHRKALCAVIDWADALQSCWFLATLTDPSHYLLSSWGQVRIFPAFLRIMHWTILASHFFQYSTVLWFLCLSLGLWHDLVVFCVICCCSGPIVASCSWVPILKFLLPISPVWQSCLFS